MCMSRPTRASIAPAPPGRLADGVGTPDPNPRHSYIVNWRFE